MRKLFTVSLLFLLTSCAPQGLNSSPETVTTVTPSTSSLSPSPTATSSIKGPRNYVTPKHTLTPTTVLTPTTTPKLTPPKTKKTVALTFDDGPSKHSLEILEILKNENIPATFFVLGSLVDEHPEVVKTLSDNGMSIQNHSYSHKDFTKIKKSSIVKEVVNTKESIKNATNVESTCVRPPYGSRNSEVRNVLEELGQEQVYWNVDPEDWSKKSTVDSILDNVSTTSLDETVLLLHDGGGDRSKTVEALPKIINFYKTSGYEFVKLC